MKKGTDHMRIISTRKLDTKAAATIIRGLPRQNPKAIAPQYHVAAVAGGDLFNTAKPITTSGKTLCGLNYSVTASDGGYVYPSVQGLVYCCGTHVACEGGSTVSFDSVKQNPAVCRDCITEIEKQKLI